MFKLTLSLITASIVLIGCTDVSTRPSVPELKTSQLTDIIAARSAESRARDESRHPLQTLEFFGLQPGMRVVEVLPGGGWYTQIIAPWIGPKGALYGVNYADDMWPLFANITPEMVSSRIASSERFAPMVNSFAGAEVVPAEGYAFGRIDPDLNNSIDMVLMIRALHNLNRFEQSSGTLTNALQQLHGLLKPGGIVGVVQHRAPADSADDWASGHNGYLKEAYVIEMFQRNGFKLVARSAINANPKDQPGPEDYVWRLPPSLRTAEANKPMMQAIGESDRMTLKFAKQ